MQCKASSISLHPGGSILQTSIPLKSYRYAYYYFDILNNEPSFGKHSYAFLENYFIYTLCYKRITSPSARLSPILPITRTK